MKKKNISLILSLLIIIGVLPGCVNDNSVSGDKVRKVYVGTGNAYKNICFIDDKGNLTGYEVDVLKEIDRRLPQYEFEYQTSDLNALLISLETNKIDIAAHQFELNPEREKKFLFAKEGVSSYDLFLVVKEDREDIKSFADIANIGGTLEVGKASANKTYLADKWNKENGNKINIILAAADPTVTLQNLATGKTDAFIHIQRVVDEYKQEFNAQIKTVGEPISVSNAYYLYRKDDAFSKQLQEDIDKVIKEMKQDGTLVKLSEQWFKKNYVPES